MAPLYEEDMVRIGIPSLGEDVDRGEEENPGDETGSDESTPFSWERELECGNAFRERERKALGKMAPLTTILTMI